MPRCRAVGAGPNQLETLMYTDVVSGGLQVVWSRDTRIICWRCFPSHPILQTHKVSGDSGLIHIELWSSGTVPLNIASRDTSRSGPNWTEWCVDSMPVLRYLRRSSQSQNNCSNKSFDLHVNVSNRLDGTTLCWASDPAHFIRVSCLDST